METITVSTTVNAPREQVWEAWIAPEHIREWYHAEDSWCVLRAENDLRVGGRFLTAMAARDGSAGFDFVGTYTEVTEKERIGYEIDGGRRVAVTFSDKDGGTEVTETFDPETENAIELQRKGWQMILENFRKHVEGTGA